MAMIGQEESSFCCNLSVRRSAGLAGLATIILSVGLIAKASYDFIEFEENEEIVCASIKNHLMSSCSQIVKTAWLIALMTLVDSTMVFLSSGLLLFGIIKEMAWLMVPYMMWIKMTLSIHAVLCIFLTTTYKIEEISHIILVNIFLILAHSFFAYIVRHYDDLLMKNIFSHSEGVIS